MPYFKANDIEPREVFPGYFARFYHSANMTLALWDISPNIPLPEHSHPHEQVVTILEGIFELTVEEEAVTLYPGDVYVIPSNAKHFGKGLTKCKLLDVFYPIRDDYR